MSPETTGAEAIVFQLGPSFATQDAARLHEALAQAAPGRQVEIDFRGVREWEAAALAVLARDLAARGPGLAVRGLSRRQLRLLGYLGAGAHVQRTDPEL
jgi:uncharacterized protein YecE (DUF72 family)